MIYGIGIDMVRIPRMERAIERWGERFLERIFTPSEIEGCKRRVRAAPCFSLRFAAKEAFSKAIGLGFTDGLAMRQIEVVRDRSGPPSLDLHGRAAELRDLRGIKKSFLSLSDEGDYAVAVVVLEV